MEVHRPKFAKSLIEEILIIVISISLAVGAERIVENWLHNKEGKESLKRLRTELIRDSLDLHGNVIEYKSIIKNELRLASWQKSEIVLSIDSVSFLSADILTFMYFASNSSEFESLKNSNKLSYIKNNDLLQKLVQNYDRYNDFNMLFQGSRDRHKDLMELYKNNTILVANKPHSGTTFYKVDGALIKKNLLNNRYYQNVIQQKILSDNTLLDLNYNTLKRIRELLVIINTEIGEEK